jgi:Zn-dependent protease with chaperone function
LVISGDDGTELGVFPLAAIQVSSRLGNLPRRFTLPSGALFECDDNDAAERLFEQHGFARRSGFLHRLERSWRLALGAVVFTAIAGIAFILYGIPATANYLAQRTPSSVEQFLGQETLRTLDGAFFEPTQLSDGEHEQAQTLFARVARGRTRGEDGYHLLLRASPLIGPNALALPDGTIILTDELWELREHNEEIIAVLAHEAAHIDRRHGLQAVYQAALVPAAIALVTGDPTQIAQMAAILPGILVQSAYSRDLEQEADDDAVIFLNRIGISPSRLADLLERLDRELCGEAQCAPGWIGTHPQTVTRAARLREGQGESR